MSVDAIRRRHSDKGLAILAESLYLLNLLFPLIPLAFMLLIRRRRFAEAGVLGRSHLQQATTVATISSILFVIANLVVLMFGGYKSVTALVTFEIYFIAVVPIFVIPGLLALLRAMNEQPARYPLIGRMGQSDG